MLINNELFKVKESDIPKIPIEFSEESRQFWISEKLKCIEGYTIGGKWMPGPLYFYINYGTILLNKGENSKTKIPAKPFLRDIEWEFFWAWAVARGLNGFLNKGIISDKPSEVLTNIKYLGNDLGTPIYGNQAKDLMMMGPREYGKSYMASQGVILHEWLFNGAKEYIPGKVETTNIIVGAGDLRYATDLNSKTKLGYDFLAKSGTMFNGKYYPHPFYQAYDGSFGKEITAQYKKKVGGKWLEYGSKSKIKVVSYKDNPYAGQGSRNSVMVDEEIGMWKGFIKAQEANLETMKQGTIKFGSSLKIGTGGSMEGGTLDAYRMFYDPSTYDLLEFEDTWEGKGKIAMFISATKRPNQFKDEEGNTDEEAATSYFLKERERLRNSKNGTQALSAHIQYNPLVPSEIFLRSSGNIFPTTELKAWLAELETNAIYQDAETVCDLIFNENGKVVPVTIGLDLHPIREFPLRGNVNMDMSGAITIYHHPETNDDGIVSWGRYLAGLDPYAQEDASRGKSLGSIIIFDKMSNTIVAEYTGRPKTLYEFYERCRKLLTYYNAQCLYENQILGTKQHFEHKNSLQYLMFQPEYIKDIIPGSKVDRGYGMHMVEQLRDHGLLLIRDWLQDEYEPSKLNLRRIRSIPLLQELILFDFDTNVDRISALVMVMYAVKEKHKEIVQEAKHNHIDNFFERRLYKK